MRRVATFAGIGAALAVVAVGIRDSNLGAAGLAIMGVFCLASSLGHE